MAKTQSLVIFIFLILKYNIELKFENIDFKGKKKK